MTADTQPSSAANISDEMICRLRAQVTRTSGFAPRGMKVLEICSEFQEVRNGGGMKEPIRVWKLGDIHEAADSMYFCFCLQGLIFVSESRSP